ncbi:glutamine--fructose-6-phosphate transaminase (isomerizing) [Legionella longbeachae]|uniref:Glutamine--fructose-6-phosphate aminotransferase [isomerizing] n=1 Tax=Legionella longbeachae serogroup 1 (strain NSW150) TaxID=661367 RepID=D3HNS6_LEGLN|nr:glutamine--fructose-6-phosphate transaminase (isomerizing) [Legionella longbeachae]VEE01065.1 glucosamine--fructose-6-phosphate aminotransferase [Legionella oakridgensis]ARB92553.1 glutamine--fructose-6-phosphate transaminase (isomerizing) [Legionella longbeachae]ARM34271.1 glutamine--fructose-6-phosphate transaminase (isomerizing) [Legionella longbeachae]EEZ96465.1 glutamine-fructose-6-phosphate transaminase [Legionella longbeachae D-4968]QIN31024.1 glutamine--fructose-6-phosphate transami
MCGIIGAVSERDISKILLEGLRRLEYRGYDSAGIAVIDSQGYLKRVRIQGKVQNLADAMQETSVMGNIGIAHTRWATHGKPSEQNAHPHLSHDQIALVHNGIIENHEKLRQELTTRGYIFTSETDTEVAAHLIHYYYLQSENLLAAVQTAAAEMHGAFALGVIHQQRPMELVAIRKGSPLVVGMGIGENFIASDSLALKAFAQSVLYLEEGDSAYVTSKKVVIYNSSKEIVERPSHLLTSNAEIVTKGPYRHFMLKEISEQSRVLADTIEGRVSTVEVLRASFGERASRVFPLIKQIHIVACGTSYHAGMVAKYWLESLAGLPTQVEIASEYRYRDVVVPNDSLFITISQSGETADTLAALQKAKSMPYLASLAICNVATSTLVREADCVFLTRAGVEIGVASTKAFTTQLAALLMLATALCHDSRANEVLKQLQELPACCERVLKMNTEIEGLASLFVNKAHALFLGRGVEYPVALEGALKLKEISYIHAEAYPSGELKHGPLALVDENMPVVAVAPNDELLDKLKSNLQEVSARGGQLFVFVDDSQIWRANGAHLIKVPSCGSWVAPIIYTIPLQLLAYHVAVVKGTDVDQPRNLAKSVTVE